MKVKEALEKYRVEEVRMRTLRLEKNLSKNSNNQDKIKIIDDEYKELETKHSIINISLDTLKEKEREVIEYLYIDGTTGFKSLVEVGMRINMSKSNVARLRRNALVKLEKFLEGRL